jgi:transcriptional regulator with XRE-family HTH domain
LLTLTGMVKKPAPQPPKTIHTPVPQLFLREYMIARGVKPADLAAALHTTEATVSRWVNAKRGVKLRRQRDLETFFKLPPGGLARPPSEAPAPALLAGLDDDKIKQALIYIDFLRSQN